MPCQNFKKVKAKRCITGLHILGGVYTREIKKLSFPGLAKEYIKKVIRKFDLHELGSFYYQFPRGNGFTGLISLVESHIAIHTWPELHYLTIDVYLCNYSKDNSVICKEVFKEVSHFFKPSKVVKVMVAR
jgi:S-adenosylmethionine decarboxylase